MSMDFLWTDEEAAVAFSCHRNTVANLRERLVNVGLESALNRKPSKMPPRQRVIDGEVEAKLIAKRLWGTACWSLVCDQLNTHKLASLYVVFEPSTARRKSRTFGNSPHP